MIRCLRVLPNERRVAHDERVRARRHELAPIEAQCVAHGDLGGILEGKHRLRIAESEVHGLVCLMLHEEHRGAGNCRGPLLDLDAVELAKAHVHKIFRHEVQLNAATVQFLEPLVDLQLEGAKLAVGDDKEVAAATRRIAQPVTMDTRPQCGVALSDSVITGYELGIPAAADVWRLACCTAEYLARHYPAGVRRGGEPVGISRARIDAGSRQMMRVAPLPVDDTACYSFLQVGRRPSALLVNYKAFSKLGVKSLVVV